MNLLGAARRTASHVVALWQDYGVCLAPGPHPRVENLAGLSQRGGKFAGLFTLQSDEGLLEILKQGLTRVSHHR